MAVNARNKIEIAVETRYSRKWRPICEVHYQNNNLAFAADTKIIEIVEISKKIIVIDIEG